MPMVQIQTPNGTGFAIHSSDPELIGRWFVETLRREAPGYNPYDEFRLRVWPLYLPTADGRGAADWSVNAADHTHDMTFRPTLDGLIAVLSRLREEQGSAPFTEFSSLADD